LNDIDGNKLIMFLHEVGLPERLLFEILAMAFHKRDEKIFKPLLEKILNNQKDIADKDVLVAAMNAEAAWLGSVENNHEKNLEINKEALSIAREYGLEVMECKLIFALSDHKAYREEKKLKPKNQIEDYQKLSSRLLKLGVDYDALRSDIELAFCYLNLSKKQDGKTKESNLNKALSEAKGAQEKARKMDYPNAFIKVKNILSEIYKEKGNKIQANRYLREAGKLKEKYF
jgi:predicted DsbA family dithiol-disulfide isomerase